MARFPGDGGAGFLIGGFAQKMFELRPKNTAKEIAHCALFLYARDGESKLLCFREDSNAGVCAIQQNCTARRWLDKFSLTRENLVKAESLPLRQDKKRSNLVLLLFLFIAKGGIQTGRGSEKREFLRVGNYSKPRGCEKIHIMNFVRFPPTSAKKHVLVIICRIRVRNY